MPVRTELWPPELRVNVLFKTFRDEMLQSLRLVVDFLNGIVEHLVKKCF
jgi:hypothetical protein